MPPTFQSSRQTQACVFFILAILALVFFYASCATHIKEKSAKTGIYSNNHKIEKHIRDEYMRWKGTRHRLGGTGRNGIDCSGFVRAVYKNAFNIELPRTSEAQVREGKQVKRNDLQAGDLVFFKPPTYPNHVGIFLSGNRFVHVSKKEGVIISRINRDYWGRYYWTARRILF